MSLRLLPILLLFLTSCAIQDVDLVSMNGYQLSGMDQKDVKLTITARINNENKFNIKIKKTKLKLSLSGSDGGELKLESPVVLLKKTEDDYEFVIVGDAQKIKSAIISAAIPIAMSGKVNVSVKGWVKGKVIGFGKKIDVDYKESLSTKDFGF
jgi:LEA14-like dessication related protein